MSDDETVPDDDTPPDVNTLGVVASREVAPIIGKALTLLGEWLDYHGGCLGYEDEEDEGVCLGAEAAIDLLNAVSVCDGEDCGNEGSDHGEDDHERDVIGDLCLYCQTRLVLAHYRVASQKATRSLVSGLFESLGLPALTEDTEVTMTEAVMLDPRCPCGGMLALGKCPDGIAAKARQSGYQPVCVALCVEADENGRPASPRADMVGVVHAHPDVEPGESDHDIEAIVENMLAMVGKDTRPHDEDDAFHIALKKGGGFDVLHHEGDHICLIEARS